MAPSPPARITTGPLHLIKLKILPLHSLLKASSRVVRAAVSAAVRAVATAANGTAPDDFDDDDDDDNDEGDEEGASSSRSSSNNTTKSSSNRSSSVTGNSGTKAAMEAEAVRTYCEERLGDRQTDRD